ncbi:MAG TPA: lipoyl synthase [bacterium]|nr:lipoyl synthase [bacterium]
MNRQIPGWVKKRVTCNENYSRTRAVLKELSINTVCESAVCPNIYECFCKNYASFMILGNRCTRDCRFCGVDHLSAAASAPDDPGEPAKIAEAVREMAMEYVVITSPTRDDLPDGGASQFAAVAELIRKENPSVKVELLIPDFRGNTESLKKVIDAKPCIISHNIETVERLYPSIRPSSCYDTSMNVLREIKKNGIKTKSGFMLGLGEKESEVMDLMSRIRETGCDYLVIGQYLKPSKQAVDVVEYIHPDIFKKIEKAGKQIGFENVFAGTFYRSSYFAEQLIEGKNGCR